MTKSSSSNNPYDDYDEKLDRETWHNRNVSPPKYPPANPYDHTNPTGIVMGPDGNPEIKIPMPSNMAAKTRDQVMMEMLTVRDDLIRKLLAQIDYLRQQQGLAGIEGIDDEYSRQITKDLDQVSVELVRTKETLLRAEQKVAQLEAFITTKNTTIVNQGKEIRELKEALEPLKKEVEAMKARILRLKQLGPRSLEG